MPACVSARVAGVPFAMRSPSPPRTSVGVFRKNRLDRLFPTAVVFFEQLLRRRDAAGREFIQRSEVSRLVAAVMIEPLAARKAGMRQRQRLLGKIEHRAPADPRLEPE